MIIYRYLFLVYRRLVGRPAAGLEEPAGLLCRRRRRLLILPLQPQRQVPHLNDSFDLVIVVLQSSLKLNLAKEMRFQQGECSYRVLWKQVDVSTVRK